MSIISKHNLRFLGVTLAVAIAHSAYVGAVFADNLDSGTYRIIDFTVGTVGNSATGSAGRNLWLSIAEPFADDRFIGTNYRIGINVANTWKAAVPKISCFETVTDGSTSCSSPSITNGMVQICGGGGCYNRARFEIDPAGNATDTLYSIQITTDPSWNTFNFIDASTFLVEPLANHDINDYLTKDGWENIPSTFNIYGLEPETQYYLRATALHGDFTETEPGPAATATTALPQVSITLDVADSGGGGSQAPGPFLVDLGVLTLGTVTTADNLIWIEINTNLASGAKAYVRSQYNGLFTAAGSYTLPTSNADLAASPGFGLQNFSFSQQYLGALAVFGDFTGGGEQVGGVPNQLYSKQILNTSLLPIYNGVANFLVKARPAEDSPSTIDYTETIIVTAGGDI